MKRSEMLKIIKQAFEDCFQDPVVVPDRLPLAVLDGIERAGMQPPLNELEYFHMDNYDRETVNKAKPYFTWEPED